MSNKITPFIKRLRSSSGTIYAFSSAIEDIGLNISERNNEVKMSNFALLDIPEIGASRNVDETVTNTYNNTFNILGTEGIFSNFELDSVKDGSVLVAESFQNYALNLETLLLSQDTYNPVVNETVSEKVFWKWLKETGAIRWVKDKTTGYYIEEADNLEDGKYSSVVKYIGQISAGNVRIDTIGSFNETYVLVPTSHGQTQNYFHQRYNENYSSGMSIPGYGINISGRESYTAPHPDALSYLAAYDKMPHLAAPGGESILPNSAVQYYYTPLNITDPEGIPTINYKGDRNNGWWYTNQFPEYINTDDVYFSDKLIDDIDLDNNIYNTLLEYDINGNTINVLRSNVDGLGIEFDINNLKTLFNDNTLTYDKLAIDYSINDNFEFNTVLLYYSVYNKTLDKILAVNLLGVMFLDNAYGNTNGYPEVSINIPELTKYQSTSTGFGTSYSFRVNITSSNMIDDTQATIIDESTSDQNNLSNFADVFVSLARSLEILNSHTKTINKISDDYTNLTNTQSQITNNITYIQNQVNTIINNIGGIDGSTNLYDNIYKMKDVSTGDYNDIIDGSSLVYNKNLNKWVPKNIELESVTNLSELGDVIIGDVQAGDILIYNNDNGVERWIAQAPDYAGANNLHELFDVSIGNITQENDKEVLTYDAVNKTWVAAPIPEDSSVPRIEELENVSISNPVEGDSLVYNSTSGVWINKSNEDIDTDIDGGVWITNITPMSSGNVGDKVYIANNTVLTSCRSNTSQVILSILATPSKIGFMPILEVNSIQIPEQYFRLSNNGLSWEAVYPFNYTTNTNQIVTVTHEDGASWVTNILGDEIPTILTANFVGNYPNTQTKVKEDDIYMFNVTTDVDIVSLEIVDYNYNVNTNRAGAFKAEVFNFAPTKNITLTGTIANRSTTYQNILGLLNIYVRTSTGSTSLLYTSTTITDKVDYIILDNTTPRILFNDASIDNIYKGIEYPTNQTGIKNDESATVLYTIDYANSYLFETNPNEITIDNIIDYEDGRKTVYHSNLDNYNVSTPNFFITATNTDNGRVSTANTIVRNSNIQSNFEINHDSRLRSGTGTGALNLVNIVFEQETVNNSVFLTTIPDSGNYNKGLFQSSNFNEVNSTDIINATSFNNNLIVLDSDLKGVFDWANLSFRSISNILYSIDNPAQYELGGFTSRRVMLDSLNTQSELIGTKIVDYNKVCTDASNINELVWDVKTLTIKAALNTTNTIIDAWSITVPEDNEYNSVINILDTNAAKSSSKATYITIQEII